MTIQQDQTTLEGDELSICVPVTGHFQKRHLYERVVAHGPEIVDREDSPSLDEYHKLLIETLRDDQVEPLDGLQQEISRNHDLHASARYICILLRDPEAGYRIASGVYGSVQDGVLAIRFVVTVSDEETQDYRRTGISQEIYRLFVAEANRWSVSQRGQAIWACVGECVDESEAFFNRLLGKRRIYVPGRDGSDLREIHYELPHLGEWKSDGTPLDRRGQPVLEHLQVAVAGYQGSLPFSVLEKILTTFWREWYVRPESHFDSRAIWERHRTLVIEETLHARILEPLRSHAELMLLSREEREQRIDRGQVIHDLKTKGEVGV